MNLFFDVVKGIFKEVFTYSLENLPILSNQLHSLKK